MVVMKQNKTHRVCLVCLWSTRVFQGVSVHNDITVTSRKSNPQLQKTMSWSTALPTQ